MHSFFVLEIKSLPNWTPNRVLPVFVTIMSIFRLEPKEWILNCANAAVYKRLRKETYMIFKKMFTQYECWNQSSSEHLICKLDYFMK